MELFEKLDLLEPLTDLLETFRAGFLVIPYVMSHHKGARQQDRAILSRIVV